jgi:hypothetical protein
VVVFVVVTEVIVVVVWVVMVVVIGFCVVVEVEVATVVDDEVAQDDKTSDVAMKPAKVSQIIPFFNCSSY